MTDPKDATDVPVDEELSAEALDAVAGGHINILGKTAMEADFYVRANADYDRQKAEFGF